MGNEQVQPHLSSSCSYMSSCSLPQTDADEGSLARNQNSASSDKIVTNTSVPSGISTCSISSILPSLTMALTLFNISEPLLVSAYSIHGNACKTHVRRQPWGPWESAYLPGK